MKYRRILAIASVAILALLILTVTWAEICQFAGFDHRENCANHMQQIGLAVIMYANDHNHQFPDSAKTIIETQELADRIFVCPAESSGGRLHQFSTSQPAIGTVRNSYIYVGGGLDITAASDVVILYEPTSNHHDNFADAFSIFHRHINDGMNVLFADAHVEFLTPSQAEIILRQVASGTRPVVFSNGK